MSNFDLAEHIGKHNHKLSRDIRTVQQRKACYSCDKGFCKRKGWAKAAIVINAPGRFACNSA